MGGIGKELQPAVPLPTCTSVSRSRNLQLKGQYCETEKTASWPHPDFSAVHFAILLSN
jgi:hypothetical protein